MCWGCRSHWNGEAAELGAKLFLRKPPVGHWKPPASHEQLCRDVVEQVVHQSGEVILDAAIRETSGIDPHHWGQLGRDLIRRSLSASQPREALIESVHPPERGRWLRSVHRSAAIIRRSPSG